MKMAFLKLVIFVVTFTESIFLVNGACAPTNCLPGQWMPWSSCSMSCNNNGTRYRERRIMLAESCGGTCDIKTSETEPCNTDVCCPEDCKMEEWSPWRHCICTNTTSFCELNGEEVWVCSRSRMLLQKEQCGGWCDHNYFETKCGNLCCRKDCSLGTWTWWSPCIGQCEQEGVQFRNLRVVRNATCGGESCDKMQINETRSCIADCCPVNCVLGEWSEWTGCNATCGKGFLNRTRFVQKPQCNGKECSETPDENQYKECTKYMNVDCVVSPWSVWTSCVLDNGRCGVGRKTRTRTVTVPAECVGMPCPNLNDTTVCNGDCCRQDCQVSMWNEWGPCSSECGAGISERNRIIQIPASCSGTSCPELLETKACNVTNVINCQMSEWESWSVCSNNCGKGSAFRSRKLLTPAYCGGQQCMNMTMQDVKSCESYNSSVDCVMEEWQPWEECRRNCDKGIQLRNRIIQINQQCQGNKCPSKLEFRYCHEKCQHEICDSKTFECGCRKGFKLSSDGWSCHTILCAPVPQVKYCPPNRVFLKNCRYPTFGVCSNTYLANCTATCPTDWVLKGTQDPPLKNVTCMDDAMWSQPEIFCSPKNTAPTDIQIDLTKTSIPENTPAGYCIYMATVDSAYDSHVYTIVKDISNRFQVIEYRLCLMVTADYEIPPTKWNITIRSTDLDKMFVEKTFPFEILNSNDPPTAVYITPNKIPENSMNNTKVGCITGEDEDPNQTLTFLLVNSDNKLFTTYTENGQLCLKVARESDAKCPTEGGSYCLLNREKQKKRTVTIMATDNGSPREKAYFDVDITLTDVNDKPTAVNLQSPDIPEGVKPGGDLVALTTVDEDIGQSYTYSLVSDPKNLFTIVNSKLRASRSFDYETEKSTEFTIEVTSVDNGTPKPLSVTSKITFKVRNVNEAPYELQLTSENAPITFDSNKPKVRENAKAVVIGTVNVKDYDEGDQVTLTLIGNADGRLALKTPRCSSVADVNVYCCALLIAYASFNYEKEPTISFSIQAADKQGLKASISLTMAVINVNDEAADILINGSSVSEISVQENRLDALIGLLSSLDDDVTDKHTYSIIDPAGLFVVQGNSLKTSATVNIDYESRKSYTVKVTAVDSGTPPMSHDKQITINILNVNEAPSDIQLSNAQVPENSDPGVLVGVLKTLDSDNSAEPIQSFTYQLIDDGAGRFEIKGNNLLVKQSREQCSNKPCILDYEQEKQIHIKVKVTDDGTPALSFEKAITVSVTDVNDPPIITIAGNSIPENSPVDTEVGVLTLKDDDARQTVTAKLMDNTDVFYLKGDTHLVAKQSLDHESKPKYNITISATDNGNPVAFSDIVLTIEVLNINEGPSFAGEKTLSVQESSPEGTIVGSVTSVDPDNNEILTLQVGGLSPEFTITNVVCSKGDVSGTKCTGDLVTKVVLKYVDRHQYTASVTAQDQQGAMAAQLFTINIVDKNDPPQDILFDGVAVNSIKVKENTVDARIAELSALDPDVGQTHTFTLTDESGLFLLQGNILRVKAGAIIDFEKQTKYQISIQVQDSGSPTLTTNKDITIMVENVNEEPTKLTIDNNKVGENSDRDTVVGNLLVEDPDNVATVTQSFIFVLVYSSEGRFKIENGQIKVAQTNSECLSAGGDMCILNYEQTKVYDIKVMVSDNGFPVQSRTFTLSIELTDQNDPPRNLQLSGYKVQENAGAGSKIGDLTFEDEDKGQTHTISLVDGSNGLFTVSSSGEVTKATNDKLDTSKVYNIVAKVMDNGNPIKQVEQRFSLTVVGDTVITLTLTSEGGTNVFENNKPLVPENSATGTVIGTLKAEYADKSQDMIFDVKESNGLGIVKLSNVTCATQDQKRLCSCQVLVADKMNYEGQSQYILVTQVVTKDATKKTVEMFPLSVKDVNEAPTKINYSGGQPSVQENVNGVILGVFTVDDVDFNDLHTYTLTNSGSGKFKLSQNGQLSVSDDANLDYETQGSINIEVKVTDRGGLSISQQFTVLVTDLNEMPSKVVLDNNKVLEMSQVGTLIGKLSTEDPDKDQTFTYKLTDDAGGRFVLDSNQLKVKALGQDCEKLGKDKCLLDFESATSHNIVVLVTDSGIPAISKSFTITVVVEDDNDPPSNLAIKLENVYEDMPLQLKVALLEVDDQDDKAFTFTITAGAENTFSVKNNTIVLNKSLDYETKSEYTITIQAKDTRAKPKSISQTFVLKVINVNEPPYNLTLEAISGQTALFPTNKPIIDENKPVNTLIGRLIVLDYDAADKVTFSTTSAKVKLFNQQCIPLTQGKRCTADVRSSVTFDYETEISVSLLFFATDSEGLKISQEITLKVSDANDPPTNIKVDGNLTVQENTVDYIIVTLSAEDTDKTQTHSFTILSDSKFFYIAHDKLKVTSAAELDFEKQSSYDITVRTTDDGTPPLYYDQVLSIIVTDVNEAPTAIKLSANKIGENSKTGDIVGSLITEDPDNYVKQIQTFTYTVINSAGGRFKVENGKLVVDSANFDYEREKSYSIVVRAEDSGKPPQRKDVTVHIDIIDANDPPSDLALSAKSIAENSPLGTVVGSLSAVDPDVGQTLSFSMTKGDYFSVTGNTVVVSGSIDFETMPNITFEIQVIDDGLPLLSTVKNFTIQVTDQNEKPAEVKSFDSAKVSQRQIPESTLINDVVCKLVAYDPDGTDKLTFTLLEGSDVFKLSSISPDCKKSSIQPYKTECSMDVLLKKIVNYEDPTQRAPKLVVMVTDQLGLKLQQEFVYNVTNSNEPPYDIILGGDVTSIPENTPNYQLGKLESVDDDVDDLHIYQVITFWEIFTVKEGILIAEKPVDYEQKKNYSVTIKSKDNGSPPQSFTKTFFFNVTDVNEAPTNITVSPNEVSNDAKVGDIVGIVTVTDPDNSGIIQKQNHTCLVGGAGVGVFTVDNSKMQLKVINAIPLDKNQTTINITCKDFELSKTVPVTLNIKKIIEIPKVIVLKDQKTVPENQDTFTVGKIEVINKLSGEVIPLTFLYLLSNVGVPFKIEDDALKIKGPLDYESKSEWSLNLTASGMDNGKAIELAAMFKVEVSDVNEAPINVKVFGGGYIPENSLPGTLIGDLNTEDHEKDQTYTYTILAVAKGLDITKADESLKSAFVLDGKTLKIGTASELLNYEVSNVFTILVNSLDSGNPKLGINDTINIVLQDVNDPPTDIVLDKYSVEENSMINTVVGVVMVTDEDKDQKHSCDVLNSRAVPFDITDDLKLVVTKNELDYETQRTYVIEVSCEDVGKDGTKLSFKKPLVVNITDVNEPPSKISITSLEISELSQPGQSVGSVKALDPDSIKIKFSVEGSPLFKIEGEDTLVTISQLDYEVQSTYTVTIKASDDGGLSSNQTFVLKVIDENEAPTDIQLDVTEVNENLKNGSVIGTLSTEDPDLGQTFTYVLMSGESDGYFAIADNKLVAGNLPLDHETHDHHKVLVKSMDSGTPSQSVQKEFTIAVKDVNEEPVDIIFSSVANLAEDTLPKTIVTTIRVDDQDIGQSHSCGLITKSTPFTILTNEKAETNLVLNSMLDFETESMYDLIIQCSDGEFDIKKTLSITVVDVNEPPESIILSGSHTIVGDAKPEYVIGQLSAVDPDQNQVHSFLLKGANSELFKVEGQNLMMKTKIPAEILTSGNPVIRITVQASDNGNPVLSVVQNFTLLITNIHIQAAELPVVALDNVEVAEDADIGTVIGTVHNMNQSDGEDILFDLEQNPNNLFSIKDNMHLILEKSLTGYVGTAVTIVIKVTNKETFESASQSVSIQIKHVDRCLKDGKTCSDDARCVKYNQTYHACNCEPGFIGDGYTCTNIDDCAGEDTCLNGATCVDSIGNFSCICPKDFNGPHCEISLQPKNPCNNSPCKNKGGCVSDDGKSYVCNCAAGWMGATCSESVDDCVNSACLAGGKCIDKHRTYVCECPEGRQGPRCQYFTTTCKADNCHNSNTDMCVPLYDSKEHACAKSGDDLVKLILKKPSVGSVDEEELKARLSDIILSMLDRTGASTTTKRRKRRSTSDSEVQVYIDSFKDNGDGTLSINFIVLNTEAAPYTKDEVIDMLYKSCSEIAKEGLTESEVCPSVLTLHDLLTKPPEEKTGGGSLGPAIGGAVGGVVVLVIIIVVVVIIKKKKDAGNGYKEIK